MVTPNHHRQPDDQLGRFVVVTSDHQGDGGYSLRLTFFDKALQSDFVAETIIEKGPAALCLVGTNILAWQVDGVLLCEN